MHIISHQLDPIMALFTPADRSIAIALSRLAYTNPFLPDRIQCEREVLGSDFDEHDAAWNIHPSDEDEYPNVARLVERMEVVLERAFKRLSAGAEAGSQELAHYEDLVLLALYHRCRDDLDKIIANPQRKPATTFERLVNNAQAYVLPDARMQPLLDELPHMFACFFQMRRAFNNIFDFIIGVSRPAIELRAAVWQSIFTHDMRRYRRVLFNRMADFTTLVTGPSGTGKELVARAVGLSRYIPFDPKTGRFTESFSGSFFALNLSALSPTLIESELFGHKRGSFTGATEDRQGWLEVCPEHGTVFLDEIGDLDATIQVKLLRVLQDRTFSRLGETTVRHFHGKIIAATHRDLAEQMRHGTFREDLYYRLCSDVIAVPSLAQRITDHPQELGHLIQHLAHRLVGGEAAAVAREVHETIQQNLGPGYAWPGNVRELEQCIRNVIVRREYRPPQAQPHSADLYEELTSSLSAGALTADELLSRYCTLVYAQTNSYEATARRLKLDRRTVKAKVDAQWLAQLRSM